MVRTARIGWLDCERVRVRVGGFSALRSLGAAPAGRSVF